jgi:hypothetical protein
MSLSPVPVSREAVVARGPDLLMVEVDGETVLMSVTRGSYFGLAKTARDIWARLETKTKACDLCAGLIEAYEGDAALIETETLEFLGKMAAAGLITVDDVGA